MAAAIVPVCKSLVKAPASARTGTDVWPLAPRLPSVPQPRLSIESDRAPLSGATQCPTDAPRRTARPPALLGEDHRVGTQRARTLPKLFVALLGPAGVAGDAQDANLAEGGGRRGGEEAHIAVALSLRGRTLEREITARRAVRARDVDGTNAASRGRDGERGDPPRWGEARHGRSCPGPLNAATNLSTNTR